VKQALGIQQLSPETRWRLEAVFAPADRDMAERLLVEECGNNLSLLTELDTNQLERFRFAALKLSDGSLHRLRQAIEVAKTDWRDLLMAAGFGEDIHAHERWLPTRSAE